jgi:hypothetical protein
MEAKPHWSSLTRIATRAWYYSQAFFMRLDEWSSAIERAINAAAYRVFL